MKTRPIRDLIERKETGSHQSHKATVLLGAALTAALVSWGQDVLRFQSPRLDGQGQIQLDLQTPTNGSLTVQSSSNLVDWTTLWTGLPAGGLLSTSQPVTARAQFFRAMANSSTQNVSAMVVNLDPQTQVATTIDQDEADLILADVTGHAFTLSFASNAVFDPSVLTATVVTNLVHLPFGDTNPAAIVLDPPGIGFPGGALLTVEYLFESQPTNLAGFWFAANGTDFGLMPIHVFSNRVEMTIYQSGGYGIMPVTATEFSAQVSRSVADPAQKLEQDIAAIWRPLQLSGTLPPLGEPLPPAAQESVSNLLNTYLSNYVLPSTNTGFIRQTRGAQTDPCADARVELNNYIRSHQQLLDNGITSTDPLQGIRSVACDEATACQNKLLALCKAGLPGIYQQLLGMDILTGQGPFCDQPAYGYYAFNESPEVKDCEPSWNGAISYRVRFKGRSGFYGQDEADIHGRSYSSVFTAWVSSVTNDPPNPFEPLSMHVAFTGGWTVKEVALDYSDGYGCEGNPAGRNSGRSVLRHVVSGTVTTPITLTLDVFELTGSSLVLLLTSIVPNPLSLPRKVSDVDYETACDGSILTNINTTVPDTSSIALSPGLPNSSLATGDTNKIIYDGQRTTHVLDSDTTTEHWHIELHRVH